MVSLEELLTELIERGGSDLHLSAGSPPRYRVNGELVPTEYEVLTPETTQELIYSVLTNDQIGRFERELELDMSFGIGDLGRFRTNVFMQRGAVGAALRAVPAEVMSLEELGLPAQLLRRLCNLPKGLILITGATGSGKSTTQAAMVDYINSTRSHHIVTIEDPIEYVHRNKRALVNQREVGNDTKDFSRALRASLRQDPDVILIGEMRDQETTEAALVLSETGHLTLGTLHTSDCVQTINRVVDIFPAYQQQQIRTQLSFVLQAVFCQQLIPRKDGRGRVLGAEIMVANSAVRSLIRDDKGHQVYSVIQTGGKLGMRTMNQSLYELYKNGIITSDEAFSRTTDPDDLRRTFQGGV